MFCPKCGKADQVSETYCRQCGVFLPDLSKPFKRQSAPEQHLKANTVLSVMTIVTSFTLSILLFSFLGFSSDTHPLIYVTASLLIAMGGWHIQTLIRTLILKKQWKRRTPLSDTKAAQQNTQSEFESPSTAKLLNQANLDDTIPGSVTEHTTRQLVDRVQPKSR